MVLFRLTPDIERRIVAHIRSGGFAHVAAEANGVPRHIFARWLARGRQKKARRRYRQFWLNVLQAKAQARLAAELDVRKKDAKFWLRYGPGKEALAPPGWGPASKAGQRSCKRGRLGPEPLEQIALVLQVLAPFPEARLAILQALEQAE